MDKATELRIESLEGKIVAMGAAIQALIACHPHPLTAIKVVSEHWDEMAAIALAQDHPDAFVNAVTQAQIALLPSETLLTRAKSLR